MLEGGEEEAPKTYAQNLGDALKELGADFDEDEDQDEDFKFAKEQMKKADEQDVTREEANELVKTDLKDPKKQDKIFKAKVMQYNKPILLFLFGFLMSFLIGCSYPIIGGFMIKCIFGLMSANPPANASKDI